MAGLYSADLRAVSIILLLAFGAADGSKVVFMPCSRLARTRSRLVVLVVLVEFESKTGLAAIDGRKLLVLVLLNLKELHMLGSNERNMWT